MDVRESYDSAASAYAEHLAKELDGKPLDRHLLNRFAEEARGGGLVVEVGCGPGQVARYLSERGVSMVGIDLSPRMVETAQGLHPGLDFRVGDMRSLDQADGSVFGVVAFYAIVHFQPDELPAVFREIRRVLAPGGLALVAFHAGDQVVHVDELFGAPVSLDFRFHRPGQVVGALRSEGLAVLEQTEREPYPEAEHPSRRCYVLARAV